MSIGAWQYRLQIIRCFLHELVAKSKTQELPFVINKLMLSNSAFLPVRPINGKSVCQTPESHEFWLCNIWRFRMTLSKQEH